MVFVRIGNRTVNLDTVAHCERQVWQDTTNVKVYFLGAAHNAPLVLSEEDAKELWTYLERVAEKPSG